MVVATPSRVEELREVVLESMQRHRVPGAALGIISRDEEITETFGVTSIDHPTPVTRDTLFLIGSTTKTITGLTAMRLVERGKLSLDDPVIKYLSEFSAGDSRYVPGITIRHLLTHTAGFDGDYFCDFGRGDDALAKAVESMKSLQQIGPTGELWSYCNSGFYVLGRIIELLTDMPYEAAAKSMVLEPLGMNNSYYFAEEVMTFSFAVGHTILDEEVKTARPWGLARTSAPPGGVISTIPDNLIYARFLMGDGTAASGERIVERETLELMRKPHVRSALDEWMGLTWFSEDHDGLRVYHHGGTVIGQVSSFAFAPERTFAIAMLTNGNRRQVLLDVSKWAYKTYLGIEKPEPESREPTQAEADSLAGRYESITNILELYTDENGSFKLRLQPKPEAIRRVMSDPPPPPPPMAIGVSSRPDRIVIMDGPLKGAEAEIVESSDGTEWLRLGLRLHRRQT